MTSEEETEMEERREERERRRKEREELEEWKKDKESHDKKKEKKIENTISAFAIFIIIFIWVWFISGFFAFLASIICFGYYGSIADKFLGVIIVLIIGPFYWFYFIYNSKYCTKNSLEYSL